MFRNIYSPRRLWLLSAVVVLWAAPLWAQVGGQKYVLSVGINQYPDKPLKGCVNDANGMYETLVENHGFNRPESQVLTDQQATRAAILHNIQRYIEKTRSGDLFVFFYSGHGMLWPDELSDERDEQTVLNLVALRAQGIDLADGHYDSALVPFDAAEPGTRRWRNLILDDELYALFARMTAKCVTVVLISDSCHSGTLAKSGHRPNGTTEKFLDAQTLFQVRLATLPPPASPKYSTTRQLHGRYLALTSSQDHQLSLGGVYDNRRQGLFTYALRKVLSQNPALSYGGLLERVTPIVRQVSENTQLPSADARFFDRDLSDAPFASVEGACHGDPKVRLQLLVRNRAGEPIADSSFALFHPTVQRVPARIEPANTLLVLRTNSAGEAFAEIPAFAAGEYLIKAVSPGYQSWIGKSYLLPRGRLLPVLIVLNDEE